MKKKNEQPNIPMLKKPVIAINIDFKKKKEHLVIGDFDNVKEDCFDECTDKKEKNSFYRIFLNL